MGEKYFELGVYSPFNEKNNCYSHANKAGYMISVDQNGNNMLTNKKDVWFTITEIEVWEVSEISKQESHSMIDTIKRKYQSFESSSGKK